MSAQGLGNVLLQTLADSGGLTLNADVQTGGGHVTLDAGTKYLRGDSGGFKLGTDLVGGTILVYEIDQRKSQDASAAAGVKQGAADSDIGVLAESLKRRIDPNDLKNIIIRPAGVVVSITL